LQLTDILPRKRILSLLFCLGLNCLIYWSTMAINSGRALIDMTTPMDLWIPFDPRGVLIYLGCYLFWAVSFVRMAQLDCWYSIMTAEVCAKLVCLVLFLAVPTTNVRPQVTGNSIFDAALRLVYTLDAPRNLFPSIHCLDSWICFEGLRGRQEVSKGYQAFSCIFALLVCLSTLLTRQHVIADVLAGVLLAELMLRLTANHGSLLETWMGGLDHLLFGRSSKESP
jgi:membrane-associated phospholipid phosphatase